MAWEWGTCTGCLVLLSTVVVSTGGFCHCDQYMQHPNASAGIENLSHMMSSYGTPTAKASDTFKLFWHLDCDPWILCRICCACTRTVSILFPANGDPMIEFPWRSHSRESAKVVRRNRESVALSGALHIAHPAKAVEKFSQTLLTRLAKSL